MKVSKKIYTRHLLFGIICTGQGHLSFPGPIQGVRGFIPGCFKFPYTLRPPVDGCMHREMYTSQKQMFYQHSKIVLFYCPKWGARMPYTLVSFSMCYIHNTPWPLSTSRLYMSTEVQRTTTVTVYNTADTSRLLRIF